MNGQSPEVLPGVEEQRCAACGADVLFLSTCPSCGTPVAGRSVAPDELPVLRLVGEAGPGAGGGAQRVETPGSIPEELRRAWEYRPRRARRRPGVPSAPAGPSGGLSAARPELRPTAAPAAPWPGGRVLGAAGGVPPGAVPADGRVARTRPRVSRRLLVAVLATVVLVGGAALGLREARSTARPVGPAVESFSVPGARGFVAAFPSPPVVTRIPALFVGKPYTATVYLSVSGGTEFLVGVYPFPLGFPSMSATQFLDIFARQIVGAAVPARLVPRAAGTFDGLPAVTTTSSAAGGASAARGEFVLDGHVGYFFVALGPSSTVGSAFARFAARFALAR